MTALSLETAKTIAIVAAVGFLAFAIISAWVIKSVTTKLIMIALTVALAFGMWTQRTNLQDCANTARENAGAMRANVTCSFFGTEVNVGT
jgi:protein-S-isoprenylcysteine O-methyltransferase Ste14